MTRTGDIIGYARVSTTDQDLTAQRDRLVQEGAVRIFDDVISGKTFDRPGMSATSRLRSVRRHTCCHST